ncbi:MAG: carbamate kinase [Thermoplasmata archaeon]|nr:carbamate kinase [Thermoplasmata archaeon]
MGEPVVRILVALGGNALQRAGGGGTWEETVRQMRSTAPGLAAIVADGHELVLTHGNGPQIGALLRQNEVSQREVPPRPMDVLGAETEGQIGYVIQQELTSALLKAKVPRIVLPIVTRIVVSRRDPAFRKPVKPVGRYFREVEARVLRKQHGWQMEFDGARGGWRRVVPSPKPVEWLEREIVRRMLDAGWGSRCIPIVAGGGGIPVLDRGRGVYEGVEAVIDKDLTAALVGADLGADTLAIVTDVPAVAVGFHKPWERWLADVGPKELRQYRQQGEFGAGSMAPKIDACLQFLAEGGRRVLITDIPSLGRALRSEAGTRVVRA